MFQNRFYHTWTSSSYTTIFCLPFTSNTFAATIFCRSDYPPRSCVNSWPTGLRTRRPSTPRRPLTINWINKWKFNIYLGIHIALTPFYHFPTISRPLGSRFHPYFHSFVYVLLPSGRERSGQFQCNVESIVNRFK